MVLPSHYQCVGIYFSGRRCRLGNVCGWFRLDLPSFVGSLHIYIRSKIPRTCLSGHAESCSVLSRLAGERSGNRQTGFWPIYFSWKPISCARWIELLHDDESIARSGNHFRTFYQCFGRCWYCERFKSTSWKDKNGFGKPCSTPNWSGWPFDGME